MLASHHAYASKSTFMKSSRVVYYIFELLAEGRVEFMSSGADFLLTGYLCWLLLNSTMGKNTLAPCFFMKSWNIFTNGDSCSTEKALLESFNGSVYKKCDKVNKSSFGGISYSTVWFFEIFISSYIASNRTNPTSGSSFSMKSSGRSRISVAMSFCSE